MQSNVHTKWGRAAAAGVLSALLAFQCPVIAFAEGEDAQTEQTEQAEQNEQEEQAEGLETDGEQSEQDEEKQKEELEKEKEKLGKKKEELSQQMEVAQATLATLYSEAEVAEYDLLTVTADLEETNAHIEELDQRIPEIEEQLNADRDELAKVVATSYKEGSPTLLDVLMGVTTFEDLVTRLDYANRLSEYQTGVVTQVKDLNSQLVQQRSDLELEREKQEKLVEEQQSRLAAVEAATASTQAYLNELSSELRDLLSAEEIAAQEANLEAAKEAIAEALRLAEEQGATPQDFVSYGEGANAPVTRASNSSAFVARAFSIIGAGYQWSGYSWTGSIRGSAFTCSGVIDFALGFPSRSHSPEMLYAMVGGRLTKDSSKLHYGDLVFYSYAGRNPGHVGIYVGNGSIIDSIPNGGVAIRSVNYMPFIGGGPVY